MIQIQNNKNIKFKSKVVFILGALRLILLSEILLPILLIDYKFYLIILSIMFFVFILLLRRFIFYDTYFEVMFLVRMKQKKRKIYYKDIKYIKYKYGQAKGMPTIILLVESENWILKLFMDLYFRFVLKKKEAISILKFLKDKEIDIDIVADKELKHDILSQLG